MKIKAQKSSICSKGCILMTVCVFDLTRHYYDYPSLGVGIKSWYIIIILQIFASVDLHPLIFACASASTDLHAQIFAYASALANLKILASDTSLIYGTQIIQTIRENI